MAKWNVTLANRASSRTELRTVDAESRTQAIFVALKTFSGPDQWAFVAAHEVPGYYKKIWAWGEERDADIEGRELDEDRERERFDTYNEV